MKRQQQRRLRRITDEMFSWMTCTFNISHAKELTAGRETHPLLVGQWFRAYGDLVRVDPAWAMSYGLNYDEPLIIAQVQHNGVTAHLIIDGWHRLYRAAQVGQRVIPSRVLSVAETKLIIC
jgi:hypothetical protein